MGVFGGSRGSSEHPCLLESFGWARDRRELLAPSLSTVTTAQAPWM